MPAKGVGDHGSPFSSCLRLLSIIFIRSSHAQEFAFLFIDINFPRILSKNIKFQHKIRYPSEKNVYLEILPLI